MRTQKQRGLSLVELVTVMGVLIILLALLMGTITRFRERTKTVVCLNNLRQIGLAIQNYAMAYQGRLLPAGGTGTPYRVWVDNLKPFLLKDDVFYCPQDSSPATLFYVNPEMEASGAGNNGTFGQTVFQAATFTVTKLGPVTTCHCIELAMTVPNQPDWTITKNSHYYPWAGVKGCAACEGSAPPMWMPGSSTISPVYYNVRLSDIKFKAQDVLSAVSDYKHPWVNTHDWMPAKLNPYTNTKTGFYYIWGVPDGPNSMIYVFSWNRSESVFKQCGYPSDCSSFVRNYDMIYDATTITDVEQFMRNKAAGVPQNWDDGYWYDLGFRVTVNGIMNGGTTYDPGSSGTLTEPMRNQYVSTSYAYNANWGTGDFRTRDTVPGRRVVLSDYGTVIATPGPVNPDSTELIKERHSGKRVNVLWMDGSVQSMTFRELATISGGTSGFKPDVWMP